jgi:acetolactate synthase-1/2/3 large subunit
MARRSADVFLDTLALHGVDQFFCVPGESYLGFLDALYDDPKIRAVTCRHEGGAAYMALADSTITGKPGVVFASRGPGATNASVAIHAADIGATPLVCFFGQVSRKQYNKFPSQQFDFVQSFGHYCRSVEQVDVAERLPEITARAFQLAQTGTPGPVIVALPTDVLQEQIEAEPRGPQSVWKAEPSSRELDAVTEMLENAERPVMIIGKDATSVGARKALMAFAEQYSLPVMPTALHQHVMPHDHPNFAGTLGGASAKSIRENAWNADVVLAVGSRMTNKGSVGFTVPSKDQKLVHIYPDADMIGRIYHTELGVVSSAEPFMTAMCERNAPPPSDGRKAWLAQTRQNYTVTAPYEPRESTDGVEFGHVIQAMKEQLNDDAMISVDVGCFSSWLYRNFEFKKNQTLIGAESGAMGMGIPGAIAAAIRHPDRQIIGLAGDGGALMTGSEMATAVRENANVTIFVSNNGQYGRIREHQEEARPGRATGINDLVNPDFASYGEVFGAKGLRIRKPEDAGPALEEALAHKGPVMVDVDASLENLSVNHTLSELQAAE